MWCPTLRVGNTDHLIRGVKSIHDELHKLNHAARKGDKVRSMITCSKHSVQQSLMTTVLSCLFQVPECVISMYVPVLEKVNVPHGWTVRLVDSPGLGDKNVKAKLVANKALFGGSARIYVVDVEAVDDPLDETVLQELTTKEEGIALCEWMSMYL